MLVSFLPFLSVVCWCIPFDLQVPPRRQRGPVLDVGQEQPEVMIERWPAADGGSSRVSLGSSLSRFE